MTMPGEQKPHWEAWPVWRRDWTGCSPALLLPTPVQPSHITLIACGFDGHELPFILSQYKKYLILTAPSTVRMRAAWMAGRGREQEERGRVVRLPRAPSLVTRTVQAPHPPPSPQPRCTKPSSRTQTAHSGQCPLGRCVYYLMQSALAPVSPCSRSQASRLEGWFRRSGSRVSSPGRQSLTSVHHPIQHSPFSQNCTASLSTPAMVAALMLLSEAVTESMFTL